MRAPLLSLATCLAIALAAPLAHADVVLAVDGQDVYLDLGAQDGVGAGTALELLHEVTARDPRTGAVLRDRFSLGALVVHKSGPRVSVARGSAELVQRILPGDRVRMLSAARRFVDPWQELLDAAAPSPTPEPVPAPTSAEPIDHIALAGEAWQDTLGKPTHQRLARWQKLLERDPRTPYRAAIEAELESLRQQQASRDAALARARERSHEDRAPRVARLASQLLGTEQGPPLAAAELPRAVPGRPLALAFLVREPARVTQAWLFVRPAGEPGFRRLPLRRDGDVYLRVDLEAELVRAPRLDWYVEAELTQTSAASPSITPVIGSQTSPRTIAIDPVVTEPAVERGRSHIDAKIDYVDFDGGLADGFDQYYQAELDFTYRFLDPVYAVRLGFGTLSGTGGPKDIIDEDTTGRCLDQAGDYRCSKVSFSYVYTEFELRLRPQVALLLRPQAGLLTTDRKMEAETGRCSGQELTGCEFHTRFGARARVRFGTETGTNLAIGAGFTSGVGTLLEAAYQWFPTRAVPVQLVVQVTDMPVPENLGVRLVADVGWRQLSWLYPSARVSYQARDIDHAGFSGGLALNFDW